MSDVDTQGQEANLDTPDQQTQDAPANEIDQAWYSNLPPDLANNPTLQKYKSQEDANKGHLELQKTLGSDRIAWPKDATDAAGWAAVHSKMGVPETSDGYGLDSVKAPEGVGVDNFDKFGFQERMKSINASPEQAKELWSMYTGDMIGGVEASRAELAQRTEKVGAEMRQELGADYEASVERGQLVVDHFARNPEESNELTVALSGTASGVRMLSEIGKMMTESSIGGFQEQASFTYTPEQAKMELEALKTSPEYNSVNDRVRLATMDKANSLRAMIGAGKQQRDVL